LSKIDNGNATLTGIPTYHLSRLLSMLTKIIAADLPCSVHIKTALANLN